MRGEKQTVQRFYESFGWQREASGTYKDSASFVDSRRVMAVYQARTMRRISRYLGQEGRLFLDAGCGALPSEEYIRLSDGFRHRVCLDLTHAALAEARAKLGDKALCVQADLANLPFRDGVFDAAVCAHVLYHIPAEEQPSAVGELERTLMPGASAAIVYTWPTCLMTRLAVRLNPRTIVPKVPGARWLWRTFFKKRHTNQKASDTEPVEPPELYFHPHDYRWFRERFGRHVRVRCAGSVGKAFSEAFVPDNALGKLLLALIAACEGIFPRLMGRIGSYPLLLLRSKRHRPTE